MNKKLTLSRETLRTLDDQDLTLVVGGSHKHHPRGNSGVGQSRGQGSKMGRGYKRGCRRY